MEKIDFKIEIEANAENVWDILFGKDTYPQWTKAFSENSNVETDWAKGSKALFVDGSGQGMVARIEENIPNKYMSIKHLGELKNGKEEIKNWGDVFENYTLTEYGATTELKIDMMIISEWKGFFDDTWPKALEMIKSLAEGNEKKHIET